jgi:prevent-host-death family protein
MRFEFRELRMAARMEVTVQKAKADFERLLDAVMHGKRVVIMRDGKAVAELEPVRAG